MTISEARGSAILKAVFEERGYSITEDALFDEEGVSFTADGWDAAKRVGFEYITTEAGDREEMTPAVVSALEERMASGDLFLLLIDENADLSEDDLRVAANRFLDRVAQERP